MKKLNFKSTIIAAAVAIIALGSCQKPAEENALKSNRLSSKKTGECAVADSCCLPV